MPHVFTEEQEQIRRETRRYLQDTFPTEKLRALIGQAGAWDENFWRAAGVMGWTGIAIAEIHGGLGLGAMEACIVAEECGRVVAGAPFVSAAFVLADAVERWGSDGDKAALLPAIARGHVRAALAFVDEVSLQVEQGQVSGRLDAVTGAAAATHLLTLVAHQDTPSLAVIDLANVQRAPFESLDNLRAAADLVLEQTPARLLDTPDATSALRILQARAAILLAWEQIGGAEAAMYRARDYALERQAFGQPIGRFQAIKHRIAEMYVAIELARGNALRAALMFAADGQDLVRAAAAARLSATEAFEFAAREAIQVHGAIGATWEHDLHLYYRRSRALATEAGSSLLWEDILTDSLTGRSA